LSHLIRIIIALMILVLLIFSAQVIAGEKIEATEQEKESTLPPPVRATLFVNGAVGAAQTRATLHWSDDEISDRPLDGSTLVSSGSVVRLGVTGWFYPTAENRMVLIADGALATGRSKIHYSGPLANRIDNMFIEYGCISLLGGIGHRSWFGDTKRYSATVFAKAGPNLSVLYISNLVEGMVLFGGELQGGVSIQYHYAPRVLFGVTIDVGYRTAKGHSQELTDFWDNEKVEPSLDSGYIEFGLLLGYDF
jgi:hypothetical protein